MTKWYTALDEKIKLYSWDAGDGHVFFGRQQSNRHPNVRDGRKQINLPKYILEKKLGRHLRSGMQANHLPPCNIRHCIAANHLYEGTGTENTKDMFTNGTFYLRGCAIDPPIGSRHPLTKLTEEDVVKIRRELAMKKKTHRQIAKEFGVSRGKITHISRGHSWKHVPLEEIR